VSPEREEGGGRGVVADTCRSSGFETGPGHDDAIKGVTSGTTPLPTFSGHSAQLIPHPNMDVSTLQAGNYPLTFFL